MTDELRVVPIQTTNNDGNDIQAPPPPTVLIGVGWMAWSGGKWNASPFCLWRRDDDPSALP